MEKFEKTKAHQRYKNVEGVIVPGVTTVLGILNKPALLAWAWKLGMEGVDFRKFKDRAADIGTIAHWLIECHLRGIEPDTSDFAPSDLGKAENAVIKFMSWWDTSKFTLVASEKQLVAVSDPFFGGTLDILAKDADGKIALVDLKTSKGIYDEYWYQLSAYAELYEQNRHFDTTIHEDELSRFIICRVGKEESDNDFEIQERQSLTNEFDVFTKCLALYEALKGTKKAKKQNKED